MRRKEVDREREEVGEIEREAKMRERGCVEVRVGRDGEGMGVERHKWEEVSQRVCWLMLILN